MEESYNSSEEIAQDLEYLVEVMQNHLLAWQSQVWTSTEWKMYDALVETFNWPFPRENRP